MIFKTKFGPEVSNKCDFCDSLDSRVHRIFDCKHLHQTRVGKNGFLTWLKSQPEATKNLMLFEQNWTFQKILQQHQLAWPEIQVPDYEEYCRYIFCDGSAYWQDQPCCTISGIGVIESSWLEYKHTVLFQRPLPGLDLNSYRAECFAILMTLSHVFKPIIYSDCLSAVDTLQHLLWCHQNNQRPTFHDHQDIWLQVWRLVQARPPDFIRIVKTKAHEDPDKIDDAVLRWQAVMNNRVDQIAKESVCNWFPVFRKSEKVFHEISKQIDRFTQHCHLIVAQAEYCPKKELKFEVPDQKPDWTSRAPCPSVCVHFDVIVPEVSCPFGDIFLQRVVNWAKQLKWPQNGHNCNQVSILELC